MAVSDVNDLLEIDLPDQDWDTVGGFVFGTLGRVPDQGDSVTTGGWRFTVERIDGRRIRQVRVGVIEVDDDIDARAIGTP